MERLLAQEDFSGGTQALSGLGRTLVLSSLQADDALAGAQLLVGEVALVLLRGTGAQPWSGPLGVTVGLQKNMVKNVKNLNLIFLMGEIWCKTYVAAKGEEGGGDVGDVFLLIQINSLEDIEVRAAVFSEGLLEPAKSPKIILRIFLDQLQIYCDYN